VTDFVTLQTGKPNSPNSFFLSYSDMAKEQQLSNTEGGCWAEVSPLTTSAESTPVDAFLRKLVGTVIARGDLEYAEMVVQDCVLTLIEMGYHDEMQIMAKLQILLRKQAASEKKELQRPWQKLAEQFVFMTGTNAQALMNKNEDDKQE
jgi:hypothetical protein